MWNTTMGTCFAWMHAASAVVREEFPSASQLSVVNYTVTAIMYQKESVVQSVKVLSFASIFRRVFFFFMATWPVQLITELKYLHGNCLYDIKKKQGHCHLLSPCLTTFFYQLAGWSKINKQMNGFLHRHRPGGYGNVPYWDIIFWKWGLSAVKILWSTIAAANQHVFQHSKFTYVEQG